MAAPPATKKEPATDTYHGVKVVDDYRWLEDWNKKDVKDWSEASRYQQKTEIKARELFEAVTDPTDGMLPWIKNYW